VEYGLGFGRRAHRLILVADVADDAGYACAMAVFQPLQVAFDAGAGERIEDEDPVAFARQPVGEVATDEAGASGDEDRSVVSLMGSLGG
jgi:hypothetical protein